MVLSDLLTARTAPLTHTLFYCASGDDQIGSVTRLLGRKQGLRVHTFTAGEDAPTRRALLAEFAAGRLDALVAMRCLDEGVDVPATRTAFLLASSGNPREFVQRRGRVLRQSPGKEFAVLYDLIATPPSPEDLEAGALTAERALLRRELRRFAEFADNARNMASAYNAIWSLADKFGVLDFKEESESDTYE